MTLNFNPVRPGYGVSFTFGGLPPSDEDRGDDPFANPGCSSPVVSTQTISSHPEEPALMAEAAAPNLADWESEIGEKARQAAIRSGGDDDSPHPTTTRADFAFTSGVFAFAASGSMLACVGLTSRGKSTHVLMRAWRQFHLSGRDQLDLRALAKEIHDFTASAGIREISFCRTQTGSPGSGLDDEVRYEALIMMLPGLAVSRVDNDVVAEWALRQDPPEPENMPDGRLGFAQFRALELAQFTLACAPAN